MALRALAIGAAATLAALVPRMAGDDSTQWQSRVARMVREQIVRRGVEDPRVLDAMRSVPRHMFVPDAYRSRASEDRPLPIGYGQTISQPYIVAFMTELLEVEPHHRVLEIGTGSGYQAAVLASLTREVYSVEIVPELADSAAVILRELDYTNVWIRSGDGYAGWLEHAPFDRIILTAAPPALPEALVDQLAPSGRLVAPVGANPESQRLIVVTKDDQGNVRRKRSLGVRFVPMVESAPTP